MAVDRGTEPRELVRSGDEYLVPLTKGLFARIDLEDGELVGRYRWNANADSSGGNLATSKNVEGRFCRLSALIMGADGGRIKIVHLDGDTMNCHRANLGFTKGKIRTEGEISYIPLTKGLEAIIDSCDLDKVKDREWYVSTRHGISYPCTSINQVPTDMVKILYPDAERISYPAGNRLDCRRESLYLEKRAEVIIEGDVAIVPLQGGKAALIDVWNLDKVMGVDRNALWYSRASGRMEYAMIGSSVGMHRVIMGPPEDKVVDHINGDGLDNREANLRIVSRRENSWNRIHPNTSSTGVAGVKSYGNRYIASLTMGGSYHYLGIHDTLESATKVRKEAELKYFGEFAPK